VSGTVLSVSSRALLQACEGLGHDTDLILAKAGLQRSSLEDPDVRLPTASATRLWAAAYDAAQDPDLALHVAAALPFGAYKVIDFLAWNAPTVGDSLKQVSKYFPLINSEIQLPMTESKQECSVGLVSSGVALSRPYSEYALAAVFLRTREATTREFKLSSIHFAFQKPASVAVHECTFECPVHFGAACTELRVKKEIWDLANESANPGLFDVLDEHAGHLLDQVPAEPPLVHELRGAIGAQLRGGDPSLESVASSLGKSPRTLQRRLKEYELNFGALLDQERAVVARRYLADRSLSISEVAFLIGFSEQSSFNHAFKRWEGCTPTEYRRGLPARAGRAIHP
jgi:AraC-like DNA-binding protein